MHHAPLPTPAADLRRQIDKTLHLAVQVPIRQVPAVFAPFAAENAAFRRVLWQGRDGAVQEWEALGFVQPGAFAAAGGKGLVQEGGVDYADYRGTVDDEADGDAVEGREVGEVHRACGPELVSR